VKQTIEQSGRYLGWNSRFRIPMDCRAQHFQFPTIEPDAAALRTPIHDDVLKNLFFHQGAVMTTFDALLPLGADR